MFRSPSAALRNILRVSLPLSVILTAYLYLYPVWQRCAFPLPPSSLPSPAELAANVTTARAVAFRETLRLHNPFDTRWQEWNARRPEGEAAEEGGVDASEGEEERGVETANPFPRWAPFRLLALGDPQLEGDTSIPNAHEGPFPHLVSIFRRLAFQTDQNTLLDRIRMILHDTIDFLLYDVPNIPVALRKRADLLGNDFYLAHIYRTLLWWTRPTHVAVLGDLLGSQWVDDDEFDRRGRRFWNRVFKGGERVPDDVASFPEEEYDLAGYLDWSPPLPDAVRPGRPKARAPTETPTSTADETLLDENTNATIPEADVEIDLDWIAAWNAKMDAEINKHRHADKDVWTRRVLNVAGNHDVGYAGDLNEERLVRFERVFGKANYELRFELSPDALSPGGLESVYDLIRNDESDRLHPELRIIVLNDMNLDTPVQSGEMQDQTYAFVNAAIGTASAVEFKGTYTVVLTHVPLHKADGVCVDSPLFTYHDHDGTLKEQNLLSADASRGFLEGIYGLSGDTMAPGNGRGRRGILLDGHDHEGCDTFHFINQTYGDSTVDRSWEAVRWQQATAESLPGRPGLPGLREITLRSMMGEFGGNAGLLSVWFDETDWEWHSDFVTCPLGTQHGWWAVHIVDLVAVLSAIAYAALALLKAAGKDVDRWPEAVQNFDWREAAGQPRAYAEAYIRERWEEYQRSQAAAQTKPAAQNGKVRTKPASEAKTKAATKEQ